MEAILSGRNFTWHGNVGSVEASDIAIPLSEVFRVRSTRTGIVKKFTRQHAELNRENELVCHVYASEDGKHTIRVYND